jgi:hypothetical protein
MSVRPARSPESTGQVFLDYYRCPNRFAEFDVAAELSPEEGYFTFLDATCYGRRRSAPRSPGTNGSLPDVSHDVEYARGRVSLPFDLSEVVANLREERYQQNSHHYLERLTSARVARRAYYLFRPLLPVSVRRHLQKIRLSGWERIAFPRWPVDFTVEILMQGSMAVVLKSIGIEKMPFIWFWPDGAPSCGMMTHDVEGPAGSDFCRDLMDLDDSYGIKSAFQLVPEVRYGASQALCGSFRSRGFEVNVHDLNHDGRLFHDREQFLQRAAQINAYARDFQSRGFRSGAMYREQGWYNALDFSYDMSVPNVAHLEPQRGGCCTVTPYFVGNILELPLTTVQDYSLFHILDDYSVGLWKTQIELILARNGLISFLTHPDYLIEKRARAVYSDLLGYVRQLRDERKLWIALPGDVDCWWRSRNQMTLVQDGESWRIEGTDSHRARVAYARLENDRVVYELDDAVRT